MVKDNEEKNRRLKLGVAIIALVTVAYYTDRFIGVYTGDWKVYAYIVGGVFGFIGGYLTLTDIFARKL